VETIWSGRVGGWHDARILICLVDQIHTFAVTHHREFVIQHLEPWLKRRDDEMKAMRHPGYLNRLTTHNWEAYPEWQWIKELSKIAARKRSREKRKSRAQQNGQQASIRSNRILVTNTAMRNRDTIRAVPSIS
jgi:hypothetical protein